MTGSRGRNKQRRGIKTGAGECEGAGAWEGTMRQGPWRGMD